MALSDTCNECGKLIEGDRAIPRYRTDENTWEAWGVIGVLHVSYPIPFCDQMDKEASAYRACRDCFIDHVHTKMLY